MWEDGLCIAKPGDDRLLPHRPRLPFTLFPERGPGMKAVSPLSLEPRDLLWLLEVEEAKRAAAQDGPVCVPSGSSGFLVFFRCTAPYPSASQPACLPHSVGELWSGWCDIL